MSKIQWFEMFVKNATIDDAEINQINFEVFQITSFCSSFFSKINIKGVKQIRIYLTDDYTVQEEMEAPVVSFPVWIIVMHYPLKEYLLKNDLDKRKEIVNILEKATKRVISFNEWDKSVFDECFNKLINDTNYDFVRQLNKWKKSPNNELRASTKLNIRTDKLVYSLEVKSKNNERKVIPIIAINYLFELLPFFGQAFFIINNDGDWISNNVYQISNVKGNIFYKIDVEKMNCDISYLPSSEEELLFLKGKMALATTDSNEEKSILIERWKDSILKEVEDTLQNRLQ